MILTAGKQISCPSVKVHLEEIQVCLRCVVNYVAIFLLTSQQGYVNFCLSYFYCYFIILKSNTSGLCDIRLLFFLFHISQPSKIYGLCDFILFFLIILKSKIYGLVILDKFFIILTSKTYGPDAGLNLLCERLNVNCIWKAQLGRAHV